MILGISWTCLLKSMPNLRLRACPSRLNPAASSDPKVGLLRTYLFLQMEKDDLSRYGMFPYNTHRTIMIAGSVIGAQLLNQGLI